MMAWYGINIPKRNVVKIKLEPLNFHLAKTKPLIAPITAEMIEDWVTKKRVRSIGSRRTSHVGPQASKLRLVGGIKAAD
jgi:hypothetical protein